MDMNTPGTIGPTPLEHPSTTNPKMREEEAKRERLARQTSLDLKLPPAVSVIGCGGVGSWLAYILALAGVPSLYLFDPDTVAPSNLNRLPVTPDWVGKNKAEAIRATIAVLRPDCDIYALLEWSPDIATAMQLRSLTPWLACTTDTLASRQSAHKWAKANAIHYIEAAAEGEFGSTTGAPAEWSSALEADPGYASVPVWVGPCVTSAYLAATHILHGLPMHDGQHRLGFDAKAGVQFNTYK